VADVDLTHTSFQQSQVCLTNGQLDDTGYTETECCEAEALHEVRIHISVSLAPGPDAICDAGVQNPWVPSSQPKSRIHPIKRITVKVTQNLQKTKY